VRGSNTFFVVNPSKDLPATEDRIVPLCRDKGNEGWDGVVGETPSADRFREELKSRDVLLCVAPRLYLLHSLYPCTGRATPMSFPVFTTADGAR
jgi:hypothetical protein